MSNVAMKLLTVDHLAEGWQCSPESVRRLVRAKKLRVMRPVGRCIRIPIESIEAWEASKTQ
jgi:excisionase family DNA binding protein